MARTAAGLPTTPGDGGGASVAAPAANAAGPRAPPPAAGPVPASEATAAGAALAPGVRLALWAEARGASTSEKVGFLQPALGGDRRCVALADVGEDELLAQVPRQLVLETPPAQPLGVPLELVGLLQAVAKEDNPPGRSLAVALLVHHERMRGDASEFAGYLDILPAEFPTMPLLDRPPPWAAEADPNEATAMEGTAAGREAAGACSGGGDDPCLYRGTGLELLSQAGAALSSDRGVVRMRELIEELDPQGLHWHRSQRGDDAALRWAAAAVQSRAHASRAGGTALVPLADCFNHSPTTPNVELCEDEASFQVRALRAVAPGEELLLSYGPFSNAELLFNAGFACLPNPDDCVLVSRCELLAAAQRRWQGRGGTGAPSEEDLRVRLPALAQSLAPPRLRAAAPLLGGAVPAGVVTLLAGLLIDAEAWRAHAEDGPGGLHECWAAERSPAAEALRSEVLRVLHELVEYKLKPRYATTLASDTAELAAAQRLLAEASASQSTEVARQRRVNILRVRVGEQRVLERLAEVLRMRLGKPPVVPSATAGPVTVKRARTECNSTRYSLIEG